MKRAVKRLQKEIQRWRHSMGIGRLPVFALRFQDGQMIPLANKILVTTKINQGMDFTFLFLSDNGKIIPIEDAESKAHELLQELLNPKPFRRPGPTDSGSSIHDPPWHGFKIDPARRQ